MKEKSLEGKEGLKSEQETWDNSTKSIKGQVSEQIVKTRSKASLLGYFPLSHCTYSKKMYLIQRYF